MALHYILLSTTKKPLRTHLPCGNWKLAGNCIVVVCAALDATKWGVANLTPPLWEGLGSWWPGATLATSVPIGVDTSRGCGEMEGTRQIGPFLPTLFRATTELPTGISAQETAGTVFCGRITARPAPFTEGPGPEAGCSGGPAGMTFPGAATTTAGGVLMDTGRGTKGRRNRASSRNQGVPQHSSQLPRTPGKRAKPRYWRCGKSRRVPVTRAASAARPVRDPAHLQKPPHSHAFTAGSAPPRRRTRGGPAGPASFIRRHAHKQATRAAGSASSTSLQFYGHTIYIAMRSLDARAKKHLRNWGSLAAPWLVRVA